MTLFGKILIGLILALSLVFASLSAAVYSAQTNYRSASETLAQQLSDANRAATDREAQLQAEIGQAQALAARLKDERDLKAGQAQDAEEKLRLKEEEASATKTGLDVQTALTGLSREEAETRRSEALAQRERNAALSSKFTEGQTRISELTDELFGLRVDVERMNAKQNELLDQNASFRQYLRSKNLDINTALAFSGDEPAPQLYGKVLDVQDSSLGNQTYVEISLGSDDGLRLGDTLSVYNISGDGGKYLGEIELDSVDADAAVGHVTDRASTGTIQKGDNVSTRL